MFIKLKDDKTGTVGYALCTVKPTGELNPQASIVYTGSNSQKPGTMALLQRQQLMDFTQPHKRNALSAIFEQEKEQITIAEAQKKLFEKFTDAYATHFEMLSEPTQKSVSILNDPAPPLYYYQVRIEHNPHCATESFYIAVLDERPSKLAIMELTNIVIFAGENIKIANIFVRKEDKELAVQAAQMTILDLSKEAAMELSDRMKKFKDGNNDGPKGM